MTQLTLTGGFANATLFEQAGVALPGDSATWDDWVEASAQGRRSARPARRLRHRPLRPPHLRPGHLLRRQLHRPGRHAGAGRRGRAHLRRASSSAGPRRARCSRTSGSPPPARPTAPPPTTSSTPRSPSTIPAAGRSRTSRPRSATPSTGWPPARPAAPPPAPACQGGAALVAIKYTKNPEEVAKVIEYLGSEPVVKEFTERTLFLPAHEGVIAKGGLKFVSDDPQRPAGAREVRRRLAARRPRRRSCCRRGSGPTPTTPPSSPAPAR